jgi:hypothetical protein
LLCGFLLTRPGMIPLPVPHPRCCVDVESFVSWVIDGLPFAGGSQFSKRCVEARSHSLQRLNICIMRSRCSPLVARSAAVLPSLFASLTSAPAAIRAATMSE